MIKTYLLTFLLICAFVVGGCGKKEVVKPNAKFIGTYQVKDVWGSSKSELGSGSLEYVLTIRPSGDSAVIIDNINKTLNGVTGKVQGDSILIDKQTSKSAAGSTYDVDPESGVLTGKNLKLNFAYNDLDRSNMVGYIVVTMDGVKDSSTTKN
ncbi:MAG: hypothetical protein ABI543_14325 [Ignavibacteria bacterium]